MVSKTNQELLTEYGISIPGLTQSSRDCKQHITPDVVPDITNKIKGLNSGLMQTIEDKRAALELRKLDIEIAKLDTPNTSIDYFKQMLDLQQQHFNQLLSMQKEQSNLMLEIEKLKLGGDNDDSTMLMLDMIKPILPQIMGRVAPANNEKEVQTMNKEQYLKKIRAGEIDVNQAWEDFKLELPRLAEKMTLAEFTVKFEELKNQKA